MACSHDIESPAVSTGSSKAVAPDLVCGDSMQFPPTGLTISLTGDGFTPMPSKTIESSDGSKEQLLLPQIALNLVEDLTGKATASGMTVKIPDAPPPGKSQLHWTSEKQMSFTLTPDLMAQPGLYDIVVTNPDGKHAATFSHEFDVVPRPQILAAQPDILCDAEDDQTVTLSGTTFLQVGSAMPTITVAQMGSTTAGNTFTPTKLSSCTPLPGMLTEGTVQSCASATFVIPKGTFTPTMPTAYTVTLTNPSPANCHSTDAVVITVVPPPTVQAIVADLVCDAQGDQMMTVNGAGFIEFTGGATPVLPTVMVGTEMGMNVAMSNCTPIPGTFVEGMAQTCTTMTFTIPQSSLMVTMPTAFPVVVTNPPPANCNSLDMVSLEVVPPPIVSAASPVAICDAQGNQTVTISGMWLLQVGSTLPTVSIGSFMPTPAQEMATGCTPVTGTFTEGMVQECTGIAVTVPKGTLPAGTYPVAVTNPAPAACTSAGGSAVNLKVEPPPTVASVAPMTICQGGGNLTVSGSGFASTATVSLQDTTAMPVPAPVKDASATVNMAGTQIAATFGGGFTVGDSYDVIVDNGDGCTDAPPHQKVTVVTGPIAFFADPDIVFAGINTRVTIYLTTLSCFATGPCAGVTMTPTGQTMPVTTLTVTGTVPGHPNRLQAIVPQGTAAGTYDLHVNDMTGCPTTLPQAITVTSTLSLALKSIIPPFGWTQQETPVTILRDTASTTMTAPFVATPRVFLNPSANQPAGNGCPALPTAIQVQSASFVDTNTLTAVVPKAQPTCLYDLIVVNPDKTVGELNGAFTVQSAQPPNITSVTPSSIVDATGQKVVVSGQSFTGTSNTITATCVDANGNPVTAPAVTSTAPTCGASGCTVSATINGSGLAVGDICVIRQTNADGSFSDYSAVGVTNSSLNLPGTHAGTSLNVGRRALVAAAGNATAAARFIYAIGGDGGSAMANAPLGSTEFASVDLFGKMGAWKLQPASTLGTARSFAAYATSGRYIYVAGGSDGTNALASAERAMILSPLETPGLDIDDLVPAAAGLAPGHWLYRVSATFAANDPDNPGGESLASDEFIVKVPTFTGKLIQVVLAWSPPADAQGTPLPNVAGYNIYRTPMVDGVSGGEVLLAQVSGTTLKYTDDGTGTPGTQQPLPLGSTGKWAKLPAMATARKGAAGAVGVDQKNPQQLYFYALLGADTAGTGQTSYEFLPITVQANGHQTVAASWTAGSKPASAGRWQLGAYVADNTVSSSVAPGLNYIYLGGGVGSTNVEAGLVGGTVGTAGGDLGTFTAVNGFGGTSAGYGVCAANNQLFTFGGQNAAPSGGATSATISTTPPTLKPGAWNNEGLALVNSRYLMGSAVQSAFIFLVGGQTAASAASNTTETVIW